METRAYRPLLKWQQNSLVSDILFFLYLVKLKLNWDGTSEDFLIMNITLLKKWTCGVLLNLFSEFLLINEVSHTITWREFCSCCWSNIGRKCLVKYSVPGKSP